MSSSCGTWPPRLVSTLGQQGFGQAPTGGWSSRCTTAQGADHCLRAVLSNDIWRMDPQSTRSLEVRPALAWPWWWRVVLVAEKIARKTRSIKSIAHTWFHLWHVYWMLRFSKPRTCWTLPWHLFLRARFRKDAAMTCIGPISMEQIELILLFMSSWSILPVFQLHTGITLPMVRISNGPSAVPRWIWCKS